MCGKFHITNINVPAGVGAPPLDTELHGLRKQRKCFYNENFQIYGIFICIHRYLAEKHLQLNHSDVDIFGRGKWKGFLVSKSSFQWFISTCMFLGLQLSSPVMLTTSRMTHKGLRLFLEQTFKHAIMYTSNAVVIIFPGHPYIWSATYHP